MILSKALYATKKYKSLFANKKWLLAFIIILLLPGQVSQINAGRILNPEPEPPKKRKCCPVGISYNSGPGKVMLEKICQDDRRVTFQMRLFGLDSVCTNPGGTILTDQSGHRYPMIGFSGIPHCRNNGFRKKTSERFYWHFKRLRSGTQKITLEEVEDELTRGLVFWAWRDVKLNHCHFE